MAQIDDDSAAQTGGVNPQSPQSELLIQRLAYIMTALLDDGTLPDGLRGDPGVLADACVLCLLPDADASPGRLIAFADRIHERLDPYAGDPEAGLAYSPL